MTAVVFLGPSLSHAEARQRLDATYLPPVRQGDVWRAVVALRPAVIGIVDGVFRDAPAVWHKEILFALSEGVHVVGAASMGALRAAELEPFGMRGVGVVFEAYRDRHLACSSDAPFEDDDEVAVVHAPAEAGWQPLSEAMVDIRCSLARAQREGIVDAAERRRVADVAKGIFFAERTWEAVLAQAVGTALPATRVAALADWLEHGRVRQKRDDALLLLSEIRQMLAAPREPFRPSFMLAQTSIWAAAVAEAGKAQVDPGGAEGVGPLAVLDELRLDPAAWRTTRRAALLDELVAASDAGPPSREEVRAVLAELRLGLGLPDRHSLDRWSEANHGGPDLIERLAATEAALRLAERAYAPYVIERMIDRLRAEGRYAAMRERAEIKAAMLARSNATEPELDAPEDLRVLQWYFEGRLGVEIPADLSAHAAALGFSDADALRRLLWREFHFGLGSGQ